MVPWIELIGPFDDNYKRATWVSRNGEWYLKERIKLIRTGYYFQKIIEDSFGKGMGGVNKHEGITKSIQTNQWNSFRNDLLLINFLFIFR